MNAITFIAMVGAVWFGLGWTLGSGAKKRLMHRLENTPDALVALSLALQVNQINQARKVYLLKCIVCLIVGVLAHLVVR
jgi:hypothetical protein